MKPVTAVFLVAILVHPLAKADEPKPLSQPEPVFDAIPSGVLRGTGLWIPPVYFRCFAFSPDGKYLAATRATHSQVYVWEVATGKLTATLNEGVKYTYGVAFSPDGKQLAATSCIYVGQGERRTLDQAALLWDTQTWKLTTTITKSITPFGLPIGFSHDSKSLATSGNSQVEIWDLATEKRAVVLKGSQGGSTAIAFSPDGALIATAGRDEIYVYDAKKGKRAASFDVRGGSERSLGFSPDGKIVLSASVDALFVCDLTMKIVAKTELTAESRFSATAISSDGKTVVTGGVKGEVLLWDAATGKQLTALTRHKEGVFAVAFSPAGKLVASGSEEPGIKLDRVPQK
jgi:WD40 repeat protein